jgi:hypothetical protein
MRYISVILIFSLLFCSFSFERLSSRYRDPEFEIHFQENFKMEMVSLIINNCIIFENEKLQSDSVLGITKAILKGYITKNKCEVECLGKKNTFRYDGNLNIKISLNDMKQFFYIKLDSGKYIGVSNSAKSVLVLHQSNIPFQYD